MFLILLLAGMRKAAAALQHWEVGRDFFSLLIFEKGKEKGSYFSAGECKKGQCS